MPPDQMLRLRTYGVGVTWTRTSREGAGQLPALLLDVGSLPNLTLYCHQE
jgi:hypothetical protein